MLVISDLNEDIEYSIPISVIVTLATFSDVNEVTIALYRYQAIAAIGTKVLLLSPSSVSVIACSWGNLSAVAISEAIAGHEDQVKFISEPDHGMYEAINKGIRMATGDVIALCHSDDFMFAKDTVSHVVKKMEETDCAKLCGLGSL